MAKKILPPRLAMHSLGPPGVALAKPISKEDKNYLLQLRGQSIVPYHSGKNGKPDIHGSAISIAAYIPTEAIALAVGTEHFFQVSEELDNGRNPGFSGNERGMYLQEEIRKHIPV